MFHQTFQHCFLTILHGSGSKPLEKWDAKVKNGHIKRITDYDIRCLVIDVEGNNVSTTYITCPLTPQKTLGIKLPYFNLVVKNLMKHFSFEVEVLDDHSMRRRVRASTYQSETRVSTFTCTMPLMLSEGWNHLNINLADFIKTTYGTKYTETLRVQIHASCRIRTVFFSDRLYAEDELPVKLKIKAPVQGKTKK